MRCPFLKIPIKESRATASGGNGDILAVPKQHEVQSTFAKLGDTDPFIAPLDSPTGEIDKIVERTGPSEGLQRAITFKDLGHNVSLVASHKRDKESVEADARKDEHGSYSCNKSRGGACKKAPLQQPFSPSSVNGIKYLPILSSSSTSPQIPLSSYASSPKYSLHDTLFQSKTQEGVSYSMPERVTLTNARPCENAFVESDTWVQAKKLRGKSCQSQEDSLTVSASKSETRKRKTDVSSNREVHVVEYIAGSICFKDNHFIDRKETSRTTSQYFCKHLQKPTINTNTYSTSVFKEKASFVLLLYYSIFSSISSIMASPKSVPRALRNVVMFFKNSRLNVMSKNTRGNCQFKADDEVTTMKRKIMNRVSVRSKTMRSGWSHSSWVDGRSSSIVLLLAVLLAGTNTPDPYMFK